MLAEGDGSRDELQIDGHPTVINQCGVKRMYAPNGGQNQRRVDRMRKRHAIVFTSQAIAHLGKVVNENLWHAILRSQPCSRVG